MTEKDNGLDPALTDKQAWMLYKLAFFPEYIQTNISQLTSIGRDKFTQELRELFSSVSPKLSEKEHLPIQAEAYLSARYPKEDTHEPIRVIRFIDSHGNINIIDGEIPPSILEGGTDVISPSFEDIQAIQRYLITTCGINESSLNTMSYLGTMLIGPNFPKRKTIPSSIK